MTLSGPKACLGSIKEVRILAAFLHSPVYSVLVSRTCRKPIAGKRAREQEAHTAQRRRQRVMDAEGHLGDSRRRGNEQKLGRWKGEEGKESVDGTPKVGRLVSKMGEYKEGPRLYGLKVEPRAGNKKRIEIKPQTLCEETNHTMCGNTNYMAVHMGSGPEHWITPGLDKRTSSVSPRCSAKQPGALGILGMCIKIKVRNPGQGGGGGPSNYGERKQHLKRKKK
jgi:hypothetical protein